MKKLFLLLLSLLLLSCSQEKNAENSDYALLNDPKSLEEKFSYAYGALFYNMTRESSIDIDPYFFASGVLAESRGENIYSDDEMMNIFSLHQEDILLSAQEEREAEAEKNLEEAETFLKINKERSNVNTVRDIFEYEVLYQGEGVKPASDSSVTVSYSISLLDGSNVATTAEGGETVLVSSMIPAIREALIMMNEGSLWRLWIHPTYAFGEEGFFSVGPNELLIVTLRLIEVNNQAV